MVKGQRDTYRDSNSTTISPSIKMQTFPMSFFLRSLYAYRKTYGTGRSQRNFLCIRIRWKGLPRNKETSRELKREYEDVLVMVERLLKRKAAPRGLAEKARETLGF